ncbi:cysteine desulfurase [Pleomorphomonas diazotrophica]|uniref:Cysteine desulfurase n=1 Tax=Pleomorphomonas diazotrophica TaxID=1166257 RepID=A0A1I4R0U3_9HYPH|nr:cysteine desulfurase family protein [Pleomorphomonas diazotrophica]PKR90281.1 cysteine desulfurase [Pleomorphomonas diazotrophica]SFM45942.1 cysteine desulfurase [Pleomorphomonas diazotrophica]
MAEARLYFDWNAGAPMKAVARARFVDLLDRPGNGSSVHAEGRAARAVLEEARRSVARLCGTEAKGVTFCSGGTEAANTVLSPDWTLFGKPYRLDRLLVSAVEHPAVARGGRFPADRTEFIPVDADGIVDLGFLDRRLAELATAGERALVSVMMANNETGVIEPVAEVARIARAHGALVHSDAVQAAGKLPIDIEALGLDVLTLSAHKIGGGQGTGAIVRGRNGFAFPPLLVGGGQESWARAGTENVAAVAAFGVAADAAVADLSAMAEVAARRDRLSATLRDIAPDAVIFGERVPRLANTLSFAAPGVAAETAVIAFDLAGVALSSGSACSSGKVTASPVLTAMGVDPALVKGGLRVSIGAETSDEEIAAFGLRARNVFAAMKKQHGTAAA